MRAKEFIRQEDFHPNDRPPGPESRPTMPAGTVRVDVSDVYDWYKLGQHISNLKGLGKHDFGKGPPSTIFSFGDENTEHKYIQDLERTGLTTTDIDPAVHGIRKGQKTDPTYNVDEAKRKRKKKKKRYAYGGYFFPGYNFFSGDASGEGGGDGGGESVEENFADGKVKGKSRPGRVKRAGASCDGSVTDLRAKAKKYGGERGKMYHWCANMKGGKK